MSLLHDFETIRPSFEPLFERFLRNFTEERVPKSERLESLNVEVVNALRNRQKRNFLSTLFLSQGVPMLLGGDEIGRTQRGNNNAYCQDNEISWYDWSSADTTLLEFTRWLIHFRKQHPVFKRRGWFQGRPIHGTNVTDIGARVSPKLLESSSMEKASIAWMLGANGLSMTAFICSSMLITNHLHSSFPRANGVTNGL